MGLSINRLKLYNAPDVIKNENHFINYVPNIIKM